MKRQILSLMLAVALGASAQQARIITLDEARNMAVENNDKVKMAQCNAQAASELSSEAFTKYFPTVSAQGLGFWANKHVLAYNVENLFTLGIIKKGITANVSAVQPIFAGGRIINGNKLAHVGEEVGRLEQEGAIDEVRLTAEQYYWQIVTLRSKKHTLESVIALVDTLERQVAVAVDAGVVMRNELLKVQIRRNELRALMVDLDNGINLSNQLLAQYIGLNGEPIEIAMEQIPDQVPEYPQSVYIAPGDAVASTVDYRLLDKQVQAADLEAKMKLGENMPTVGVGAGFFYDDLLNQNYSFGAVFVSVSVPISQWWGGSHAAKRSRLQAETARLQREDLSQMLELNMSNTWDDLTAAYRKMTIAHESIEQATENLRINTDFYQAGVTTVTELLDAQTLYRQSEDQYSEAYGNYRLCRARYLNATGQQPD